MIDAVGQQMVRVGNIKISRKRLLICLLPWLLMLVLFYSLAVHMYFRLGGWPQSIGEIGFATLLRIHAAIVQMYFWLLLMLSLFAWPVALLACVAARELRRGLVYLAYYGICWGLSYALISAAPSRFLYWWWD